MRRMLILADDLSGASDCATACIGAGLSAAVVLGDLEHDPGSDVLAVDCDTRHIEPAAAADQMVRLLQRYQGGREYLLFKKLDSTLRGNVAAELAAVLGVRRESSAAGSRVVAVMAPAFPFGGRTTVGGHQFVHGSPLHTSETWRRRISSSGSSSPTHIPSLLTLSGLRPAHIALELVRSGENALRQAITGQATGADVADVLVCDAETDDDLRTIALASLVLGQETVWAGSAGLARHLPFAAGLSAASAPLHPRSFAAGPVLLVIGSMSSVSREQVEVLGRQSALAVLLIPPVVLLAGPQSPQWSDNVRRLRATLLAGSDVVVALEAMGPVDHSVGRLLSRALATMMASFADTVGALVASGGETARAILEVWGVTGLRMVGELEPGLPFAVTEGWRRALPVLTKAGAFGNAQSLVHCRQFLHTLDRSSGSTHCMAEKAHE